MIKIITIEAEEEDISELIMYRDLFRNMGVPVNSFAALVFRVLDGVRTEGEEPKHPITEAPDVEP